MSQTIDTLAFVKMLRESGMAQSHAEAIATAVQECVVKELVTSADLDRAVDGLRRDLSHDMARMNADLSHQIVDMRRDLTIKLGGLLMAGVAALAVLIKLG